MSEPTYVVESPCYGENGERVGTYRISGIKTEQRARELAAQKPDATYRRVTEGAES